MLQYGIPFGVLFTVTCFSTLDFWSAHPPLLRWPLHEILHHWAEIYWPLGQKKKMLHTCKMGLLPLLLPYLIDLGLQNHDRDIVHAKMVGWIWRSILNAWYLPEGIRGDPLDEGVLHLPIREAFQSFLQSRVHKTLRKFLRIYPSPRPVDIPDNVQLPDKPMAHRHIRAVDSRPEWFNADNGPWLQGTNIDMKGLQKLQQAVAGHNIRKCGYNLAALACISVHSGMHSTIDTFILDV